MSSGRSQAIAATLVPATTFGTSGVFVDATTLPESGTYSIRVDYDGSSTGAVTLTLYDVPADVSTEELTRRLASAYRSLPVGDPSAAGTLVGPLLDGRLRDLLAGKKIVLTGVTGFIGEQILWKILTELPDTTAGVLVRRKGSASAKKAAWSSSVRYTADGVSISPSRLGSVDPSNPVISSSLAPSKTGVAVFVPAGTE